MSRHAAACAAALVVVAATLSHDAFSGHFVRHARPAVVLVVGGLVAAALLVLAPRVSSWTVTVGAGIAAGGAIATLVSGAAWVGGVPDPIVRGGSRSISPTARSPSATCCCSPGRCGTPG